MTERIDHAAEAIALLENYAPDYTVAQVHATLALVEQQRIANLLTYIALPMEIHGTESDAWPEINDGLGLT